MSSILSQGNKLELNPQQLNFLWVTGFPLFSITEGENGEHADIYLNITLLLLFTSRVYKVREGVSYSLYYCIVALLKGHDL